MSCDFISLLLQAIGGDIAASAHGPKNSLVGIHIMLAAIMFHVATFTLLYILAGIFIFKFKRNISTLSSSAAEILYARDFRIFVIGIFIVNLELYVRCMYRIVELATGWTNSVMRDERGFVVLDGVMCAVAILA
jgi:hypothetical protein